MPKKYNISYNGDILHSNVTLDESSGLLQDLATRFYSEKDDSIDPTLLEIEEITNAS